MRNRDGSDVRTDECKRFQDLIELSTGKIAHTNKDKTFVFKSFYSVDEVRELAEGLKNPGCPSGLTFAFVKRTNQLADQIAEAFSKVLKSGECPSNLDLTFTDITFTLPDLQKIMGALSSGQCPEDFSLSLSSTSLDNKEAWQMLRQALESKRSPEGLKLTLSDNKKFNDIGLEVLVKALASDHCPPGLVLDLDENQIGNEGLKVFAKGLQSGSYPPRLTLKLTDNKIDYAGFEVIAEALESGCASSGLTLFFKQALCDYPDNRRITKAFTKAFKSGRCPPNLTLIFVEISLDAQAVEDLLVASKFCSQCVSLHISCNITNEGTIERFIEQGLLPAELQQLVIMQANDRRSRFEAAFEKARRAGHYSDDYCVSCADRSFTISKDARPPSLETLALARILKHFQKEVRLNSEDKKFDILLREGKHPSLTQDGKYPVLPEKVLAKKNALSYELGLYAERKKRESSVDSSLPDTLESANPTL